MLSKMGFHEIMGLLMRSMGMGQNCPGDRSAQYEAYLILILACAQLSLSKTVVYSKNIR